MYVEDLRHKPDYTPYAAFRTIDRYQEGHIKIANLQDFFRQFGNYLVENEIFSIIRRIDTDGDAQLSYEEFADFLNFQVNAEAPLTTKAHPWKGQNEFATESKQGANIEKLMEKYCRGNQSAKKSQGLQISP